METKSAAIDFVLTGVVTLVPLTVESLKKAKRYMEKYGDLPMYFADAALVVLAGEFGIQNILTLDHNDFGIYRVGKKNCFNILP